jgi:hypothetical protein
MSFEYALKLLALFHLHCDSLALLQQRTYGLNGHGRFIVPQEVGGSGLPLSGRRDVLMQPAQFCEAYLNRSAVPVELLQLFQS